MISSESSGGAPPSLLPTDDVHAFWANRWSGGKLGWHKEAINPHLQKYTNLLLDIEGGNEESRSSRIFVPLCGKSVDLAYLATHPKISHVVGIDIVRKAAEDFALEHPDLLLEEIFVNECLADKEKAAECEANIDSNTETLQQSISTFHGKDLTILIRDLFDFLSLSGTERANILTKGFAPSSTAESSEYLFDAIYDRASNVAIDPSLRKDYSSLLGQLLKPGGVILLVSLDRRKTTTDEAKKDGPPFSLSEEEIRQLYESQTWVESVTLLDEVNDLTTDADKERWEKKGVLELYETVLLIKKKR